MHKLTEISAELARADNAGAMLKSSVRFALTLVGVATVLAAALFTLL